MSTAPVKPYLIAKDESGQTRLTLRQVRYNSQGYPWVLLTQVEQSFDSVLAARRYASEQFGAKPGEFASK